MTIERLEYMGMRRTASIVLATLVASAFLFGCGEKKREETVSKTEHRRDFGPEEFGIGKPHTRNATCNREIDKLLEEIRACYNSRPESGCDGISAKNNDRIGRVKGLQRCNR